MRLRPTRAGCSRAWLLPVSRVRLWKRELQRLADELAISIEVHHLPPGTSKWNKIEHRLFSFITQNWRAKPLISSRVIVDLIAATTTKAGSKVQCELDPNSYPKGVVVSEAEMDRINIQRAQSQRSYISAVSKFSRYFGRSPERLDLEDVRAFQVHLVSTGISWPGLNQIVCACRWRSCRPDRQAPDAGHVPRRPACGQSDDRGRRHPAPSRPGLCARSRRAAPGTSGNADCGTSCRRCASLHNHRTPRHGRRALPFGTP